MSESESSELSDYDELNYGESEDSEEQEENNNYESHSLRSLQRLLVAFRAATNINDDENEKTFAFKITDPTVFNNLIVVCLKYVIEVFDHHLKRENQDLSKTMCTNKKWKTLEPLVKSYLNTIIHMFKQITEDDMIYLIVKESEKIIPYYACLPKLANHYLKQLLEIWGTAKDKTRILAFLNIRKLASISPAPFIDFCLKGIYTTFVQYCKDTTPFTIPSINLMRNCAVEMYGIDFKSSYQSAFRYIRQLAIHLRNSSHKKNDESFNAVYNWQYIHCLDYWSNVLATYCDQERISGENSFQELIYPFVQVSTGTGTFIPLAPYLFDILQSSEIRRNPKPTTLKPLDFMIILKAPKNYLHTRVYQEGIYEKLLELLFEYYSCFCSSIAFPELVIPAIIQIKRHIKHSKNLKFNKQLQQLVEKLEQNSKFIEQHRSQIDFSPNDHARVVKPFSLLNQLFIRFYNKIYFNPQSAFSQNMNQDSTPLGSYVKSNRRLKEKKEKMINLEMQVNYADQS
ncbi:7268_t:CDS:10 [Diversispora eburnea]|uniref:7268_t:CDS:1 n=1 Tax=Diversispora eburnea TaxID=1213867 RepID=A0A9N8V1P1_9GLOM|nr:7268_t:CDS:10 [Diversispora eburnea]